MMERLDGKLFRDPVLAKALVSRIEALVVEIAASGRCDASGRVILMEVCGTHTVSIFRSGLRGIFDGIAGLRMLSGPGCPVCVTTTRDIDAALDIAAMPGVVFATFGDMIKVPGSEKSFAHLKSEGADVRIVYSPADLIPLALANPGRHVSFFSVGFETTTPGIAYTLKKAKALGIRNLSVVAANKLVPPALFALCEHPDLNIHGFILPGHVSTIIGKKPYLPVAQKYGVACAITGFEPVDILLGVSSVLSQIAEGRADVETAYARAVPDSGNPHALAVMSQVFDTRDAEWRGVGVIPASGLALNRQYEDFDAVKRFQVTAREPEEHPGCKCGEVLIGKTLPTECELFGRVCSPENPIGACMVSAEGTCATYYRFKR